MKAQRRSLTQFAIRAPLLLALACLPLMACSASQSPSGGDEAVAADSFEGAEENGTDVAPSTDPAQKFVGTWKIAAVEQKGVTMGGNFGELLGVDENGDLVISDNGTGTMAMGEESAPLSWAPETEDSIYVTIQSEDGVSTQEATLVTLKDDALFFPYEQDGEKVTLIYTSDGMYANARQISTEGTEAITSESELLGTWKTVGLNMGGISMYGEADRLEEAMGGGESSITFEEGGVAAMSSGDGTWTVGANGATITSEGLTGKTTCPITKRGDEIFIDYSEAFGGTEFILVLAK